jgi:hypothetical protein
MMRVTVCQGSVKALAGKASALQQIRQLSEVEGTSWGRAERIHFMPALDLKWTWTSENSENSLSAFPRPDRKR